MSWFLSLFPIPDLATRHPLTWNTFTCQFLPLILCCYVMALLVILPRTFPIRLALLPVTLYFTLRCATQVDIAKGYPEDYQLVYLNYCLTEIMTIIGIRACITTFQFEPYRRLKHSSGNTFLDALDLCFNLRGLGWCWSTGVKVPKETRDTSSTASFLRSTLQSAVVHFLLFDFTLFFLQSLMFSEPVGASIFSLSLTPLPRYARSSLIALLLITELYSLMLTIYHIFTILALCFPITALRHTPEQWPPLFDRPWMSTSLHDFCGCRWHQLFRQQFVAFGGMPLFYFFGRMGGVIGVFLISGVSHHIWLWGMGRGTDFRSVVGFALMAGVGMLAERTFKRVTGRRMGGFGGWVWTLVWGVSWGSMFADAWIKRGFMTEIALMPHELRPSVVLVRLLKDHGWS